MLFVNFAEEYDLCKMSSSNGQLECKMHISTFIFVVFQSLPSQIAKYMNSYLLRCIITLWDCKCFIVRRDVNRRPLGTNKSTRDPCIPNIQRGQEDQGRESKLKQQGLRLENLWHNSWSAADKNVITGTKKVKIFK